MQNAGLAPDTCGLLASNRLDCDQINYKERMFEQAFKNVDDVLWKDAGRVLWVLNTY